MYNPFFLQRGLEVRLFIPCLLFHLRSKPLCEGRCLVVTSVVWSILPYQSLFFDFAETLNLEVVFIISHKSPMIERLPKEVYSYVSSLSNVVQSLTSVSLHKGLIQSTLAITMYRFHKSNRYKQVIALSREVY